MRTKRLFSIFLATTGCLGFACSRPTETEVNKRSVKEAATLNPGGDGSSGDSQGGGGGFGSGDQMPDLSFAPLLLQLAKNAENLPADFLANLSLMTKTKEDQIVLFGKNGKSWVYGAPDKAPLLLEPTVVVAQGSQLYTLPEGEFWVVSPNELGRRKAGSVDQGSITIERFSLATVQGNKDKMRVLFAGVSDIILHLETHLAVLSVKEGQATLNQFDLSKLPVNLGGSIRAAGRGANGSFWLAAGDQMAVVEPKTDVFTWKKVKLSMSGYEDYGQFAAWPDAGSKMLLGDVALLSGDKIWSISGAPIASATP